MVSLFPYDFYSLIYIYIYYIIYIYATNCFLLVLTTYFQWQRHSVGRDQDENFTKEFLGQAMAILSRVWKQQSSVIAQEKSCFSVTPKKIRQVSVFIFKYKMNENTFFINYIKKIQTLVIIH